MRFSCIFDVRIPVLRLFCVNYVLGYYKSTRSSDKRFEVLRESFWSHLKTFEYDTDPWELGIEDKVHPSIRMEVVAIQQSHVGSMPYVDGCVAPTRPHSASIAPLGFVPFFFRDLCGLRASAWVRAYVVSINGEARDKGRTLGRHLTPLTSIAKYHWKKVLSNANWREKKWNLKRSI